MEESNKYTCSGSGALCEGKPWISLNLNRWDDVKGPVTFSSYLEYRGNLNKLPKQHFDLIINKEDFNEPRPVIHRPQVETFNFLTETEMDALTNEEYRQYTQDLNDYFIMNPIRSEIYLEQMSNDSYARNLEESYSTDEDVDFDDY